MANFMDKLKSELLSIEKSKLQYTENGALGYTTTGKSLLDLNFKVASYRSRSTKELILDYLQAFNEDANLAVKWLFFARDIREGLGERDLFRKAFYYLITTNKSEHISTLFRLIPQYGRWDDLLIALGTPHEDEVIKIIKTQLFEDIKRMNSNSSISLLSKWLPRENTSNKERVAQAKLLASKMGMSAREYRKITTSLNKYIKTIEIYTSAKKWNEINYEEVPSLANLKYRNAFLRNDEERRREYLDKLSKGEVKINMSVGFPHDIVHSYLKGQHARDLHLKLDEALEGAWKNLKSFDISNTIVVGDSSGSMTSPIGNTNVIALEVAHALGIYCGDHNTGVFKNKMITFSGEPKYLEWDDNDTLLQKLQIAFSYSEIANTNIEKVFNLILNTAIKNHSLQEEIPANILVISDMEFDQAVDGKSNIALFKNLEQKYNQNGYKLPRLIFWNVNSRTSTIPLQEAENGVALVSGFSTNILKMVLSDKLDPFECLKDQLLSDRYKDIIWN
jgi:hypothetical protein